MTQKQQIPGAFVAAVHEVVRRIPRGQVMSYGAVAARAGFPRAARAVGTLMKHNFDLTIPCHRVIRSDGRVGRYNGGEQRKIALLRQEGVVVEGRRIRSPRS